MPKKKEGFPSRRGAHDRWDGGGGEGGSKQVQQCRSFVDFIISPSNCMYMCQQKRRWGVGVGVGVRWVRVGKQAQQCRSFVAVIRFPKICTIYLCRMCMIYYTQQAKRNRLKTHHVPKVPPACAAHDLHPTHAELVVRFSDDGALVVWLCVKGRRILLQQKPPSGVFRYLHVYSVYACQTCNPRTLLDTLLTKGRSEQHHTYQYSSGKWYVRSCSVY